MATDLTISDARKAAINEAGQIVVAAVSAMRSGTPRSSPEWKTCCSPLQRNRTDRSSLAVAGAVAVLLTEDPSLTDAQITSCLYCEHLFESRPVGPDGKDLDVYDLLEVIEDARAILAQFEWLHEIVTERLIECGEITPSDIYDTLHGGANDLRHQRTLPSFSVMVCALLALLVEYL